MFHPDSYISSLIGLLTARFHERLLYVGLQGSYLRGEANEHSDIDVMVIIRDMTVEDLAAYRKAIEGLDGFDKSCGFICGDQEIRSWNSLEICHLLHTTRDYLGTLRDLVPAYAAEDVRTFVKLSLGNLYHDICHRFVHASHEVNVASLPGAYKSVFFILQNLHYLRTGRFIGTKRELLTALSAQDSALLETAMTLSAGGSFAFDAAFSQLFTWCKETMITL